MKKSRTRPHKASPQRTAYSSTKHSTTEPSEAPARQPGVEDIQEQLRGVLDLFNQHDLTELEVEREGWRVRLRREIPPRPSPPDSGKDRQGSSALSSPSQSEPTLPDITNLVTVRSPIVGIFYRSPAPDADPYVEEGDTVNRGQVLCIVEAMKLMNEIEAEVSGQIVKVLVESAKPVEYGQPLLLIDPTPTT